MQVLQYFCKFVTFSILLRTQMVHSEVSFIISIQLYVHLSIFAVCFVVTFERLAKTFHFFKMIYAVARNAHKYKPSQK